MCKVPKNSVDNFNSTRPTSTTHRYSSDSTVSPLLQSVPFCGNECMTDTSTATLTRFLVWLHGRQEKPVSTKRHQFLCTVDKVKLERGVKVYSVFQRLRKRSQEQRSRSWYSSFSAGQWFIYRPGTYHSDYSHSWSAWDHAGKYSDLARI